MYIKSLSTCTITSTSFKDRRVNWAKRWQRHVRIHRWWWWQWCEQSIRYWRCWFLKLQVHCAEIGDKPMYNISTWKHPRTRYRWVTIILLLSASSIEILNDVHAVIEKGWHILFDMHWFPVLTDTHLIAWMMIDDKEVANADVSNPKIIEFRQPWKLPNEIRQTSIFLLSNLSALWSET